MSVPPAALVADDDPLVRELIRAVLEDAGWEVVGAEDGDQAIACYEPGRYAIVVLDCRMPGRDGSATLAWIRTREPELGVLFVSGNPPAALTALAREDRRCGMLGKPFSPRELLAAVGALRAPTRAPA